MENYAAEGVRLLINGVTAAMIENAGKRLGFELGPLAMADKIEIQSILPQLDSTRRICRSPNKDLCKKIREMDYLVIKVFMIMKRVLDSIFGKGYLN